MAIQPIIAQQTQAMLISGIMLARRVSWSESDREDCQADVTSEVSAAKIPVSLVNIATTGVLQMCTSFNDG